MYVCVWLCLHMCWGYMCSPMCEHMEARSQCWVSPSKALHIIFTSRVFPSAWTSTMFWPNRLPIEKWRFSCFHIPMLELLEHTTTPGFYMDLGIQTVLYAFIVNLLSLSHPLRLHNFSFILHELFKLFGPLLYLQWCIHCVAALSSSPLPFLAAMKPQ